MNKSQAIKSLETREDRHTSTVFDSFAGMGEALREQRYSQKEAHLSEYQNFIFKRAMYGLKMYSDEEIKAMHWQKRKRIKKVHARTQSILNEWKQSLIVNLTNVIFGLFHKSVFAQDLIELYSATDNEFTCNISFKDLGLTKTDVIEKMLAEGLLPYNFKELVKPIGSEN